ncbi:unnamed protein product [Meloidogyne enterolobii]|uniref:Uncharacterized protein n=1 Tax=Meloidogyne enterolobii TaxID=390850 RepID=A0ACB0Z567_MELEN
MVDPVRTQRWPLYSVDLNQMDFFFGSIFRQGSMLINPRICGDYERLRVFY